MEKNVFDASVVKKSTNKEQWNEFAKEIESLRQRVKKINENQKDLLRRILFYDMEIGVNSYFSYSKGNDTYFGKVVEFDTDSSYAVIMYYGIHLKMPRKIDDVTKFTFSTKDLLWISYEDLPALKKKTAKDFDDFAQKCFDKTATDKVIE